METIQTWMNEHPDVVPKIKVAHASVGRTKVRSTNSEASGPSHITSYQMFSSGKSLKEIAVIRDLSPQTIERHVFKAYQAGYSIRSEEHTSELQSRGQLVCRLLLEKKNKRM